MTTHKHGFVVSDLHLMARRHDAQKLNEIRGALKEADFLVLNGDIFDFSWAYKQSVVQTAALAAEFLKDLCNDYPHCNVHYIMGNHDDYVALEDALSKLSVQNFSWHPTHVQLGGNLFMHGDLALSGNNPFARKLKTISKKRSTLSHYAYDAIIATKLHRPVIHFFTRGYAPDASQLQLGDTLQK